MLALRAMSSAVALGLSYNNARMRTGVSPRVCAASSAAKLLPRPEANTTMSNMCRGLSGDAHALGARSRNDLPYRPCVQPQLRQRSDRRGGRVARHDHGVTDAAIERTPHLA